MFFLSSYDHFQRKLIIIAKSQGFFPWLFSLSWEQRKLKDICSVFTDGDWIESKDQSDQGVRLIQTGNVGVTEYLDKPNNKKWVSEDTFERLHCTEVLSGDILISRLPEPAGRACIVPKIGQKMITAVDCTIARIAPEYSSEYVVQYLSTQDYFDEVNNCLAGGTRQRISRGNLSSFLIPLPCSKAEQERIGGFFRSLDDLITLHQHEPLFLVMLFSGGSCVFKSAWEQRKVGEILEERDEQAPKSSEYPLMAFIANEGVAPKGDRYDRSALVNDTENKPYKKTEYGDFIYSSNNLETGSIGLNTYGKASISPVYSIFHPTDLADSDFIGRRLVRKDFINEMVKWRQGVIYGQWRIHESDFIKIEIPIPSLAEQKRIGAFFKSLDNLITLHQRKGNLREKKSLNFAWELRKLGEVGKARSGIGFPDAEQGGDEGIPFFKVSDMNTAGNENEMTTANNYVTEAQIVSHRWHPITELPALFFAKVGAAVMLNRKRLCRFPFLLDNNTMAYSLNEDCWDADFAKALFETVDLTTLIQVGALPSYNAGDVENMEIYLPAHSEQQKIGALFKHLDNLITLHQREHKSNFRRKTNVKQSTRDRPFLLLLCSVDKGLQRGSGP